LSPSKINDLQCPYRFRSLHVQGEERTGAEATALALGSLAHEVAADYVRHLRSQKMTQHPEALRHYAQKAWAGRSHSVPQSSLDDFQMFMDHLAEVAFDPLTIVNAEERLIFTDDWLTCAWDAEEAAWGGMIDVLGFEGTGADASAYAIDWTTASISGQFAAKKDLQLRMYGLLIHKAYKVDDVHITTKSLRTGATRDVDLGADEHAETEERIRGEAERLGRLLEMDQRMTWPAIPNAQCGICVLRCPAYAASKSEDFPLRLDSVEEARGALRTLTILDSKRKRLAELLKLWCAFQGEVEASGMVAGMWPRETVTFPTEETAAILAAAGLDHWSALKVDKRALQKITKKSEETRLEVMSHSVTKTADRFGVKAAGIDDPEEE